MGDEFIVTPDGEGKIQCPHCANKLQVSPIDRPRSDEANCPYCGIRLSLGMLRTDVDGTGFISQEKMYYCPRCGAVLGFSQSRT